MLLRTLHIYDDMTDISMTTLWFAHVPEEKALFVPLKGVWFDAFENGRKTTEYRRAGPRWNARTCKVGRRVVLSRGYSGKRLRGRIVSYREVPCHKSALDIYPDAPLLAAIGIRLD